MQCSTTHRDHLAFPDPETWDPNRCLIDGKYKNADSERAKELYMPFLKGPRACIGKTVATVELKVTIAVIVMKICCRVDPKITDEGMTMMDHFLAIPRAGKCELVFKELQMRNVLDFGTAPG